MVSEFDGDVLAHQPVLYQLILDFLKPKSPGEYVDCTIGAGGHAWGILQASAPDGKLLGFDLDPRALEIANQRLSIFGKRVTLINASYTTLLANIQRAGFGLISGIVLDLGVSSMQLDSGAMGFSFKRDGVLDMRFNPNLGQTAADLINSLPEDALADIIWKYGEERHSRRIARAIAASRPVYTTSQLSEIITRVSGKQTGGIHPATRTFQALRIAVNHELDSIAEVLPQAVTALAQGGRLAVISFHSLEDRIIKNFFRRESRDCICPPEQPVCNCGHKASLKVVTTKPVTADDLEINNNPRSRSAKLRVAEKL